MSFLLAIVLMVSVMTVPAQATASRINARGTIQCVIPSTGYSGPINPAYSNRESANDNAYVLYVDKGVFPVKAILNGEDPDNSETFIIKNYGTYYYKLEDYDGWRLAGDIVSFFSIIGMGLVLRDPPYAFATVIIKPLSEKPGSSKPSTPKTPTKEDVLKQKTETLVEALDLPCWHYSDDYCRYIQEIKAFLSGEWDGSRREGNDDSCYHASRYVMSRTYYWIGSDLVAGKTYSLSANVDYSGYKTVIPGNTRGQEYSLAVSYTDGEIEKWSLFEKQDAWTLDAVANGSETIDTIIPLASKTSGKDDAQVLVNTTDTNGRQHMYSLRSNGVVNPLT